MLEALPDLPAIKILRLVNNLLVNQAVKKVCPQMTWIRQIVGLPALPYY
jgi:hypothetical protein